MKKSLVFMIQNNSFFDYNNKLGWLTVKIGLAFCLAPYLINCLFKYTSQPFPVGICTVVNCATFTASPTRLLTIIALSIALMLYVLEIAMTLNLFFLSTISIVILSLEESNGMSVENGVLSLLFFTQFLAYLINVFNADSSLNKNRIQYPLQIIAAVYVLAGISKVWASGSNWFWDDAPKFTLEIQRVFFAKFATNGEHYYQQMGICTTDFFLKNIFMLKGMLFFALLFELFAFIMLFNRKLSFIYGFVLLAMHLGIYLIMNITFPTIMVPMLVITINPLYWVVLLLRYNTQNRYLLKI